MTHGGSEGKFLLSQIAEDGCHNCNQHLGRRWVESKNVHQQFESEDVDAPIGEYDGDVAPGLCSSSVCGLSEGDMASQVET